MLRPLTLIRRAVQTGPPSRRNSQRSCCQPPSRLNRWDNHTHFLCSLWRFQTMAGQSLSSKDKILPSYLKVSILLSTWSCARNSVPAATQVTLAAITWRFFSAPLQHILMPRCPSSSVSSGGNISHLTHRGRGPVPSSRIFMVSSTCWCIKCSRRLVQLVALPGHPSTGQSMDIVFCGEVTQYSDVMEREAVEAVVAWTGLKFHYLSGGGWPLMPLPTLHHTPHTPPSGAAYLSEVPPCLPSTAHSLLRSVSLQWAQYDTPSPPSLPR